MTFKEQVKKNLAEAAVQRSLDIKRQQEEARSYLHSEAKRVEAALRENLLQDSKKGLTRGCYRQGCVNNGQLVKLLRKAFEGEGVRFRVANDTDGSGGATIEWCSNSSVPFQQDLRGYNFHPQDWED